MSPAFMVFWKENVQILLKMNVYLYLKIKLSNQQKIMFFLETNGDNEMKLFLRKKKHKYYYQK